MARTFRYHAILAPQGQIFDTDGRVAPYPPSPSLGWVEHLCEMNMTAQQYADRVIERAVKEELARQGSDRQILDAEHRKKFGEDPHTLATNDEVANLMDNKTADGKGKITPPRKSPVFTRNSERNK